MNYEFHVGDYVETWDGWIGYVDGVYTLERYLDIIWTSGNKIVGEKCRADWNTLHGQFKRIGAYDFTKKEKKKIARLSEDDSWLTFRNTNKANVNLCYVVKRINELVDAVNLLLDKSTES